MQLLPWIVALAAFGLLSVVLVAWVVKSTPAGQPETLPNEWALASRPVFSVDERRVYRLLREALPHHVILAKLPLVRFCQPTDPATVRYWFDLLGTSHVTFAVCSPNGRVLAAIDLDTDRQPSRRSARIKQSVLSACRVRYLRCPVDPPPSTAELQLLVPSNPAASRGPQPAPARSPYHPARDSLATTSGSRRAERAALWQDSSVFQDSFFAPDSRGNGFGNSGFGASEFGASGFGTSRLGAPPPFPSEAAPPPRRHAAATVREFSRVDDRPGPSAGDDGGSWGDGDGRERRASSERRPDDERDKLGRSSA